MHVLVAIEVIFDVARPKLLLRKGTEIYSLPWLEFCVEYTTTKRLLDADSLWMRHVASKRHLDAICHIQSYR